MAKSIPSPAQKIDSSETACWLCGGWGHFPVSTPPEEATHSCPVCVDVAPRGEFIFRDTECDPFGCHVVMKRHPMTGATLCEHSTNPEAVFEFEWSLPHLEVERRYRAWLKAVHAYERGEGGQG